LVAEGLVAELAVEAWELEGAVLVLAAEAWELVAEVVW
jgi:hypothetical protein